MAKKIFKEETDVLKYQRERIKAVEEKSKKNTEALDDLEKRLNEYIKNNNIERSVMNKKEVTKSDSVIEVKENKSFDELVKEANKFGYRDTDIEDVATEQEIKEANNLLNNYYNEYLKQYELDKFDYAVCGIVGSIAALIDFFLVTKVKGTKVTSGALKKGVENIWEKILSPEKIKKLEEKYKVTYDISLNSSKTSQEVLGLCPKYHRFQSLGHDPIVGLVFGVSDLMKGEMTAIDGTGRMIIQSVKGTEKMSFIESIITVFGHFLSDVGTKSKTGQVLSVPAPFTPLLQMIQFGSIEYKGQDLTVGDLVKKMYGDGYNFNHFIGMSIPVLIIEIIVRLYFVVKEIFIEKRKLKLINNPKLNTMLCLTNGILFAENAGKLVLTKNPFAINYVSWIATAKYSMKTVKWQLYDKQIGKIDYAQEYIDLRWEYLEQNIKVLENDIYIIE